MCKNRHLFNINRININASSTPSSAVSSYLSSRYTSLTFNDVPSIYILNPTSLAKPHAIEHLTADLISYNIAIIAETWYKVQHLDGAVAIPGYNIYSKDRQHRRSGGVCIY